MTMIRWNPAVSSLRDLDRIHDEMNRLFDSAYGFNGPTRGNGSGAAGFAPPVDIEETRESFLVRLDLPGVSREQVKVSLLGDTLTVRGERREQKNERTQGVHRSERIYGAFERSFTLGVPVRSEGIKATFRDGVLEIEVPKAEEAKVREIEVQVDSR